MRATPMRYHRARLSHWFVATCLVAVLCVSLVTGSWGQGISSVPSRVVAIGDVPCASDALGAMLQSTGLLDARLRWSGGAAVLVQVGHFLDRGPKDRQV